MEYIIGIVVSLIVEGVKKWGNTNSFGTIVTLLVLSVAGGAGYVYLASTLYWQTIVTILTAAATFHGLIIKQVQK